MRIVADEKIAMAEEAFAHLGDVTVASTQSIAHPLVRDADALFVRSETRVNRELLDGSRVRFVGTATAGADHVDEAYLRSKGIGFASAPGCNADSVKEYVIAALLCIAARKGFELKGKTLGIVGVGNIGSRVSKAAKALGMQVLLNDPPLARRTGDPRFRPLGELMDADFITLHVPLTRSGRDRTFHLFDEKRIANLSARALLLNTSRGAAIDTAALKRRLSAGKLGGAALDVWENEPRIDIGLLEMVDLGTSHISGYSLDGKVRGTQMIYEAACQFFGHAPRFDGFKNLPAPSAPRLKAPAGSLCTAVALHGVVRRAYDIAGDDRRLRAIGGFATERREAYFQGLRKNYPPRREFSAIRVVEATHPPLRSALEALGFLAES